MKEGRCVCVCVFLFHIHQPGIPPFVLYAAHPPPVTPDSELTAAADYFLRLLGVMTNPPPHTATGGWLLKVSALPWLLSYHGRSVHCSVPGILLLLFRGSPPPPLLSSLSIYYYLLPFIARNHIHIHIIQHSLCSAQPHFSSSSSSIIFLSSLLLLLHSFFLLIHSFCCLLLPLTPLYSIQYTMTSVCLFLIFVRVCVVKNWQEGGRS